MWELSWSDLFNPQTIIRVGGITLLLAVVFSETGLMIGILFPGDSLMFTAGLLTAVGILPLPLGVVISLVALAVFLGDFTGYTLGRLTGKNFFQRKESLLFRKEYVELTRQFYQKHGAKILILGKFLPIIRTFAPLLAGVIRMPHVAFLRVSLMGAIAWPGSLITLGYFLGNVPWVEKNYTWIILGMVFVTTVPILVHLFKQRKKTVSTN
ncbi:MAG: DedA family protein [Bacteroidia bacterium]